MRTFTHPLSVDDIVQRELSDEGVELEQEGEGLADTTWSDQRLQLTELTQFFDF